MSKKVKTIDELLEKIIVPIEEQPYELPKNWVWTRLGAITQINPKKPKLDFPNEQSCSFLPMSNVNPLTGRIDNLESREFEKVKKGYTYFEENDVLFAKITPCMENGNTVIATDLDNGFGFGSTEFYVLRQNSIMDMKYVYFLLRSKQFRREAKANMSGAVGQQRVPKWFLESYPIGLPPLNEQKRIAEKVERLLGKIDEAKRLIDEAKETFELRRAAILDKAFRGELTKKWRISNLKTVSAYEHIENAYKELVKQYDEQCINAKNLKLKKPKKPEIIKHFSLINEEVEGLEKWVKTTFIHLCVLQRGYDLPVQSRVEGKYPIVSAGGIIDHHHEFKIKGHGVTTGRSGTIGSVFFIEEDYWPLNTSLYVDYFNGNDPKYVYYFMLNFNFKPYSSSTAVPTLNRNNLFNVEVIIPPLNEQKVIVKILDDFFKKEFSSLKLIEQLGENLKKLAQSILSKAFRGELGTNDSTEESAIKLLKSVLQEQVK